MEENPAFYTINEFANKLRISTRTVYRMIDNGRINAFRLGLAENSSFRVPASEIQRLAEMEYMKNKKE